MLSDSVYRTGNLTAEAGVGGHMRVYGEGSGYRKAGSCIGWGKAKCREK